MSSNEVGGILTVDEQFERIRQTDTKSRYVDLVSSQFYEGSGGGYLKAVNYAIPDSFFRYMSSDYYRMLGLLATLVAGCGFSSMLGQLYRHHRHEWNLSPFDPKQIAALIGYFANATRRAYKTRAKQEEYFRTYYPDLGVIAKAPFGISIGIHNSGVKVMPVNEGELRYRYFDKRPICLADISFLEKLYSALEGLSGKQADNISNAWFKRFYLPKLQNCVGDLFDCERAILEGQMVRRFGVAKRVEPRFRDWKDAAYIKDLDHV